MSILYVAHAELYLVTAGLMRWCPHINVDFLSPMQAAVKGFKEDRR